MGLDKWASPAHSSPARQKRNRWRATLRHLKMLISKSVESSCRKRAKQDLPACHATTQSTSSLVDTGNLESLAGEGCAARDFLHALESLTLSSSLSVVSYIGEWLIAPAKAPGIRLRELFPIPPIPSISRLCRLQHAAIQSNACSNNTPSFLNPKPLDPKP